MQSWSKDSSVCQNKVSYLLEQDSKCRQKVSLLAPLVYLKAYPRDQCWDHSHLSHISTVLMLKCFQCKFPLLSDDTVIYCSASTPNQAQLQLAFNTVQHTLCDLKLVMFSNTNSEPLNFPSITTFQGSEIESASHYKYLGTAADYPLSLLSLTFSNWWQNEIGFFILETSIAFPLRSQILKPLLTISLCML